MSHIRLQLQLASWFPTVKSLLKFFWVKNFELPEKFCNMPWFRIFSLMTSPFTHHTSVAFSLTNTLFGTGNHSCLPLLVVWASGTWCWTEPAQWILNYFQIALSDTVGKTKLAKFPNWGRVYNQTNVMDISNFEVYLVTKEKNQLWYYCFSHTMPYFC